MRLGRLPWVLGLAAAFACAEGFAPGQRVNLAVIPVFSAAASGILSGDLDQLHIRITRIPSNVVVMDTTVAVDTSGNVDLPLTVPLRSDPEQFEILLEGVRSTDATVLYQGLDTVRVTAGSATPPPVEISVSYIGPCQAKSGCQVTAGPQGGALTQGDSLLMTVQVDSLGIPVLGVPASLLNLDTALIRVRNTRYIVARTGTPGGTARVVVDIRGDVDTLRLTVYPPGGPPPVAIWEVDAKVAGAPLQLGTAAFPFEHPDRAFAVAAEGDTIHVATGTYDFVQDGQLAVGVVIRGGTPGDTANKPVFRDAQQGSHTALWLQGGLRTVVRNVAFKNFAYAVNIDGVSNLIIEDSKITSDSGSFGSGIYACGAGPIDTVRVDRSVLLGDSSGSALENAYCGSRTALITVRDSKISGWYNGIIWTEADSLVVLRSSISDNNGYGINVAQQFTVNPAVYVAHSRLERNNNAAISGSNARRLVLDTSVVRALDGDAIQVSGGCGECGGDTVTQVYLRGDSIYMQADDYTWLSAYLADTVVIDRTLVRFADSANYYAYGSVYARTGRVTNSQFVNIGSGVDPFYFQGNDFLADNVTMSGCTEPVAGCDEGYGFELYAYSGVLDARVRNSRFTNIGYPLYTAGGSGGIHEATNLVMDSVRYGIQIDGDSIVVRNNTLTRVWNVGISTGGGGGARGASTIANNTVTCIAPPDSSQPVAISLFTPHEFHVDANSVGANCGYGAWLSGVLSGTTLRGNTFRSRGFGVFVSQFDSSLVTLDSNAISGAFAAVQVSAGRVTLTHNNIGNGNYYGVYIPSATGYAQTVSANNAFVGNANYAIYAPSDVVNATNNWWGNAAGPGGGVADSASGAAVTTTPFLTSAPGGLPLFAPRVFTSAAVSAVSAVRVASSRTPPRPAPTPKRPRAARAPVQRRPT